MSGLARIERALADSIRLQGEDLAAYERITRRISRTAAALRLARKRGDATAIAKAEKSVARAAEARDVFVAPWVAGRWAPRHVVVRFEAKWSGPGREGMHVHIVEMSLDHLDLCGPYYTRVRTVSDTGGPPENPRSAPDGMGLAWFAVSEYIASGKVAIVGQVSVTIPEIGRLAADSVTELVARYEHERDLGYYGASDIGSGWPISDAFGAELGTLHYNGRTTKGTN